MNDKIIIFKYFIILNITTNSLFTHDCKTFIAFTATL